VSLGPMFFEETVNSYHYIEIILAPFFRDLTVDEEIYSTS
jgi:hypothetical protein